MLPVTRSGSPSPSRSPSAGARTMPTSCAGERIGGARDGDEGRARRVARVLEGEERPVSSPATRSRSPSPSRSPSAGAERHRRPGRRADWPRRCARERRARRVARVLEVDERRHRLVARDQIEIAVAIEVAERRRRVRADVVAIERVRGARAQPRRPGRRAARVLEVGEGAVRIARNEIEIAVAVEIAERGRRAPDDLSSERIGRRALNAGGSRAARVLEVERTCRYRPPAKGHRGRRRRRDRRARASSGCRRPG